MATKQKLALLGGDARSVFMARELSACGYTVFLWGLGSCCDSVGSARVFKAWEDALEQADAVILPLPATTDEVNVSCPLEHEGMPLRLSVLFDAMQGKRLYGGRLSDRVVRIARKKGIDTVDYFQSEALQIRNAVPTAEGAISIAMQELPVTVEGLSCAVIGYGRIGKVLAHKLKALGAFVTVYARRSEARAEAEINGHSTQPLNEKTGLEDHCALPENCRAIFNTVPQRIITRQALERVPKNCVLIDLASAPGGFDFSVAHELGLRTVWGTALPGKCTPESAGVILARTIHELLEIQSD